MKISVTAALILVALAMPAPAQQPSGPSPLSFDVASIKLSMRNAGATHTRSGRGLFTAGNVSVKDLAQLAYGLRDHQIIGAPGWADSERYDINAKSETNIKPEHIKPMLQSLLA